MLGDTFKDDVEETQNHEAWGHVDYAVSDGKSERFAEISVDRAKWRFALRLPGGKIEFFDPLGFADFLRNMRRSRQYTVYRAPRERGGRPVRVT